MAVTPLKTKFGKLIKDYLRNADIRQKDLAVRLDVSAAAVSQMIHGKIVPNQKQLDTMCLSLSLIIPVRLLESKKQKTHKTTTVKVKEIKLRPGIEANDFFTKIRNAERFLFSGNKLKITLMMRGREMEYKDKGFEAVKRAIAELSHVGHADSEPKLMGRNIGVSMSPLPVNQRKLKFSQDTDEMPEDDSEDTE